MQISQGLIGPNRILNWNIGKGKQVNIPVLLKYAWQHKFCFWRFRIDQHMIKCANHDKSGEYRNVENLIKRGNGFLYEKFGWFQEPMKKEQK